MNNTKDCCLVHDGVCCAADLEPDASEGIAGDEFNDTEDTVCKTFEEEFAENHKGRSA